MLFRAAPRIRSNAGSVSLEFAQHKHFFAPHFPLSAPLANVYALTKLCTKPFHSSGAAKQNATLEAAAALSKSFFCCT